MPISKQGVNIGFAIADLRFAIEKPLKINLITIREPKNVFLNGIEAFLTDELKRSLDNQCFRL